MTTTDYIQTPYLEDTELDGKNYIQQKRTKGLGHYIKRIYDIDFEQILTHKATPRGDRWNEKKPDLRQDFIWGVGASAFENITKGKIKTDSDIVETKKLLKLFREHYKPKRNTYPSRGELFRAKQEDSETSEVLEVIRHITQKNKIVPDKNNHSGIE